MWSAVRSRVTERLREAAKKAIPSSLTQQLQANVKDQVTQTVNKISSSASGVYEKSKADAIHTVRKTSKDVSDQVTTAASGAYQKGKSATVDAVRVTSSKLSNQVQSASEAVQDASYRAASQTTDGLKRSSHFAANVASESIRQTTGAIFENVQDSARKSMRWFFWWSLAAIGVYGIATTVPKELVRYALQGGGDNDTEKNESTVENQKSEEESGTEDTKANGQGWMSWIRESVVPEDDREQNSRWRLPWSSVANSEKKSIRSSDRWWA